MKNQPSVLVIDDEQIVCDSCHRILENEDYKVETNTNPTEGYKKAIANDYDLLLLDLNMSELDGMKLLTKLRKDKPELPVIIITGYPTNETREETKRLGVNNYILKPFQPNEILDPVKRIISRQSSVVSHQSLKEWKTEEKSFYFYKNGWLQKGADNLVRVGGLLPVLLNETVESIKIAKINDYIYRGLPIAELIYPNDVKIIIPSPVSGKIIEVNNMLAGNPAIFEEENTSNSWIATIQPEDLEKDLTKCELRNILYLNKDADDSSKYFSQLTNLGYSISKSATIEELIKAASEVKQKVVVIDAKSFGEAGPSIVEKIKEKFSDSKIIVFNTTDAKQETLFREKKIFCYAVDPVSSKEISSILYGAFCFAQDRESLESTRTSYLPQTVRRIQITNRSSKKVVLLSYDNILLFNKGIGFVLINSLLENSYPIEIDHSRNIYRIKDPMSQQKISENKQKNDKVIILYKDTLERLTGSAVIVTENYENNNSANNKQTKIAIQPADIKCDDITFDLNTTKALAELIEHEMTK
jgi:DNA-binding response OmpR family regulator